MAPVRAYSRHVRKAQRFAGRAAQLSSQLLIGGKQLPQPHKRPHNADVDLDCALSAQDA
jgi:hypothetical protein